MAIASGDIKVLEEFTDSVNRTEYEGDVKTFIADTLYLLFVGSQDAAVVAKPVTVATTGLTWVEVESYTVQDDQQTCYRAVPTSGSSSTTVVTFDSAQESCFWNIVEIKNADTTVAHGANAIIQAESSNDIGTSFSHTLSSAVTTSGNLVLCNVWAEQTRKWTAGAGQTALTAENTHKYGFAMYNLSDLVTVSAETVYSIIKLGIVLEISGRTSPTLTLPTVTDESSTELSGTVTCDLAGDDLYWYVSTSAVAPSEAEILTPTVSVEDGTQAISASGVQTVASFGTSFDPATTYYVYYLAQNGDGNSNIAQAGPVTTAGVVTLHTLELIDKTTVVTAGSFVVDEKYEILVPGTTDFTLIGAADSDIGTVFVATGVGVGDGTAYHIVPCICESTNWALGITAELWPAGVENDKEVASLVEAIDTANTSTPQYNVTFSVAPDDTASDVVNIIYDADVGDIKSVTGGIALASDTGFNDATHTC